MFTILGQNLLLTDVGGTFFVTNKIVNGSLNLELRLVLNKLMNHNSDLKEIFRDVLGARRNSLRQLLKYHEEIHSIFKSLISLVFIPNPEITLA